jgi:uncharacterized protein (DUF433 family)
MAYSTRMAAALSGATMGQLRTWRQDRGNDPILRPELAPMPALYSFRDVLALRAFAHLRQDVSLQKIRRALVTLKKIGEVEHLSSYSLVADGDSIVLVGDDRHGTDLVQRPGQRVIATMADILQEFAPRPGVVVPHLLFPKQHVSVDPETQGGQPVIAGTRIPFDAVAELVEDGVPPEKVADYYPGVTADAARDAVSFARRAGTASGPARTTGRTMHRRRPGDRRRRSGRPVRVALRSATQRQPVHRTRLPDGRHAGTSGRHGQWSGTGFFLIGRVRGVVDGVRTGNVAAVPLGPVDQGEEGAGMSQESG